MEVAFDSVADALYISLTGQEIIESEEVQPGIILDFDSCGKVVGVEILSVSKRGSQNSPKVA